MLRIFNHKIKNIKNHLCNEVQFWYGSNFFSYSQTHVSAIEHLPAYAVNYFSTSQWILRQNIENIEKFNSSKMIIKKDGTVKKKKKPTGVKVYILNEKGISSSMYLQEAEKLAQRQKLELKKVDDINGVAAYKLATISDLLESEFQNVQDEETKKEKIKKLLVSSKINMNDLQTKINQIKKFLDKGIKVFIRLGEKGSELNKLNAICSEMEKSLTAYSINKLVTKSGYQIKILPQQTDNVSDKKKE